MTPKETITQAELKALLRKRHETQLESWGIPKRMEAGATVEPGDLKAELGTFEGQEELSEHESHTWDWLHLWRGDE